MLIVVLLHGSPQPSTGVAAKVFVGSGVGLLESVKVRVAVHVALGTVNVRVCVTVFVFHGVHDRVSVGGQVIVGVGDAGLKQQIVRSTHDRHSVSVAPTVMQKLLFPPDTHPGHPPG